MIAPAIIDSDIPIAFPIPNSATPIVAIVDHELPVTNEMTALTIQAAIKKYVGLTI